MKKKASRRRAASRMSKEIDAAYRALAEKQRAANASCAKSMKPSGILGRFFHTSTS